MAQVLCPLGVLDLVTVLGIVLYPGRTQSELVQTSLLPKSPYMGMFSTWRKCLVGIFEVEKCASWN